MVEVETTAAKEMIAKTNPAASRDDGIAAGRPAHPARDDGTAAVRPAHSARHVVIAAT